MTASKMYNNKSIRANKRVDRMEQNKNSYQDMNNVPDNPYNQYYREYIVDPGKAKEEISRGRQIASTVLCAVSNMVLLSFCVYWAYTYFVHGISDSIKNNVSNSVTFSFALFAYFAIMFVTTSVVAKVLNRKSKWATVNFILIGVVFVTVMKISFYAPSAVTRVKSKHSPITSNWEFYSLRSDGKTLKAKDFNEDDIPKITIEDDSSDERYFFVTYQQTGQTHYAKMILLSKFDRTYRIDFFDSGRDMEAEVDEDKLILTIDDVDGIVVIFKAAEDETLIPVDEYEGPDYMKVKMTGDGTVEFTNESDTVYDYKFFYKLEFLKDGKWYYARYENYVPWPDNGGGFLSPGCSMTRDYDLSCYGKLSPGEYRLAVGDEDACLYAYFTVNPDGTYSY